MVARTGCGLSLPQPILHVFTYAQIIACNKGGNNSVCSGAQDFCNNNILGPLAGDWDVYYVPTENPDPYPPPLDKYLNSQAVTSKIGSHAKWEEGSTDVYDDFAATGDWMRTSLPVIEKVINTGVRTVIYDGDADYIGNFKGVEAMVRVHSPPAHSLLLTSRPDPSLCLTQVTSLNTKFSSQFAKQKFANFTVNGATAGIYKNAGTFSYVRFFGAGHQVPAYSGQGAPRGAAALQMFTQIMSGKKLSGT